MGFDPYHLNKLSSEEWDNLLTKALKSDKKLYETLILTRCKLSLKFTDCNLTDTEEPFKKKKGLIKIPLVYLV